MVSYEVNYLKYRPLTNKVNSKASRETDSSDVLSKLLEVQNKSDIDKSDGFKRSKSDKDGKSDTLEPMDVKVIQNPRLVNLHFKQN